MSYTRYKVIRHGEEVTRVHGVNYYTQEVNPPQFTFYDASNVALKIVSAEAGDVVRPVVVGFYDPFPPIDQSESRIETLRMELAKMQGRHHAL